MKYDSTSKHYNTNLASVNRKRKQKVRMMNNKIDKGISYMTVALLATLVVTVMILVVGFLVNIMSMISLQNTIPIIAYVIL